MTFTTIAALKLYTGPIANNESVTVLGYYAPGDGGGGTFYWDSASTAADDGGMVIAPVGNPPTDPPPATGRWKRPDTVTVNVRQFGAHGNNTDNDQPYIQKAMSYAAIPGIRKKVFFPSGTYLTSTVDITGVWTIEGESPRVRIQGINWNDDPSKERKDMNAQDIFYWKFPDEAGYIKPEDVCISNLTFYLDAKRDVSQNFMRIGLEGERIGNCAIIMPGDIGQCLTNITINLVVGGSSHNRQCGIFFGGPPYKLSLIGKVEIRDTDYGFIVGTTDKIPQLIPRKIEDVDGATGTITCANNFTATTQAALVWDNNDLQIPEIKRRRRYYVVNPTPDDFQLSATAGGSPITFTDPVNVDSLYVVPAGASTLTFACDEWSSEHLVLRNHRVGFSVPNITQSIFNTFGCQSTKVSVRSLVFASNSGAFQPHTFTFEELYTEGPFDTAYMNNKEYALLEGEYIKVGSGPRCRGGVGTYITIATNHSEYDITAVDDQNKIVITGDDNYIKADVAGKDQYIVDQGVGNVVEYVRYDASGDTARFLPYLNRKSLSKTPGGAWPDYIMRGSAQTPYQNDATCFFYGQAQLLFNPSNIVYEYLYDDATLDVPGYLRWPAFPTPLTIRKALGSSSENLTINRFFPKSRWVLYAKVRSRVSTGTDNITIGVNKQSGTSGAAPSRVVPVGTAWQVINVEVDHRTASDDFVAEFYVKGLTAGLDFAYFVVVPYAGDTFTIQTNFGGNVLDMTGSGDPDGVITAAPGSTFRRTDTVNTVLPRFFVKTSGTGNTGWVALS